MWHTYGRRLRAGGPVGSSTACLAFLAAEGCACTGCNGSTRREPKAHCCNLPSSHRERFAAGSPPLAVLWPGTAGAAAGCTPPRVLLLGIAAKPSTATELLAARVPPAAWLPTACSPPLLALSLIRSMGPAAAAKGPISSRAAAPSAGLALLVGGSASTCTAGTGDALR